MTPPFFCLPCLAFHPPTMESECSFWLCSQKVKISSACAISDARLPCHGPARLFLLLLLRKDRVTFSGRRNTLKNFYNALLSAKNNSFRIARISASCGEGEKIGYFVIKNHTTATSKEASLHGVDQAACIIYCTHNIVSEMLDDSA